MHRTDFCEGVKDVTRGSVAKASASSLSIYDCLYALSKTVYLLLIPWCGAIS